MKRLKYIVASALIMIASVFGVFITAGPALAMTVEGVENKYIARGLYTCYKYYLKDKVEPNNVRTWYDLMKSEDGVKGKIVGLPPSNDPDTISCSELFKKIGIDDNFQSGTSADAGNAGRLEQLGYEKTNETDTSAGGGSKCFVAHLIEMTSETNGAAQTKPIGDPEFCATVSDGKITRINNATSVNLGDSRSATFARLDDSGTEWGFHIYYTDYRSVATTADGYTGDKRIDITNVSSITSMKWADLVKTAADKLATYKYEGESTPRLLAHITDGGGGVSQRIGSIYYNGYEEKSDTTGGNSIYKLKNDAYKEVYKAKVGGDWPGDTVNDNQHAALYNDFLNTVYGAQYSNCADKESDRKSDNLGNIQPNSGEGASTSGWHEAKVYKDNGKVQYCYVSATKDADRRVHGITDSHGNSGSTPMMGESTVGFLDILNWLNAHAPDSIPKELASSVDKPGAEPGAENEPTGDEGSESCFDGGGALGWILCPILEGTSWAVNQLYSGFIEPALTINADLLTFDGNGDKGAYATWQTFQTFANIAFVIMILVVIFSQLTGVGIDNYGIKRILPRLIIAAILINLSFIICQLLVDLSNILGVSLKNLFNNLGPDYKAVGGSTGGAIFVDILIGVVAVGGAFLALGLGVLIPILVAAISALIAIFFLFLVLAGRQAAVVILVVISPIALVMYMLPNTKKYFDKFVKIFATLLVVFPVCGLLMGGGDFASRVLLQAGQASADSFSSTGEGFFYQISAVLVSIVPFFFIPSLVKGSLAGLGNIGSKISSIGSKVGSRASGRARSTLGNTRLGDPSRFKRWSNVRRAERRDSAEREANLRRAQSRVKRLNARRENGKVLDEADVRRLAVSQATVDKYGGEDLAARTSLAMLDYGNSSEKDIREAWRKAFKAGDGNQLRAVTNVMQSRFGSNAAKFIGDDLEGLESEGIDIANNTNAQASMKALQDHANNDGKFAGDLKAKAYDAQAMIASGGVTKEWKDADGTVHKEYGNLSHFTAGGGGAKLDTIEDISTQGTGAIRRAVAAGAITAEQATSVLSSSDQRIQSGIASDAGKRDELMNATFADGSTVADHVKKAQADQAREAKNEKLEQEEKELQVQHHEDAMAIGQKPITVGSISFRGYETPAGFTPAGDPVQDADGHWIYTDKTNGRTWDATTGRYGKPIQGPFPKP